MNIWIDLSNSPHILFFKPIILELENREHQVFVTHRDFAQTSRLCKLYNIDFQCIGKHGGQGVVKKVYNISDRAKQLRKFAKDKRIDLAISHNSYAHAIAAKTLRIPYVTIMDYEYQPANHISFRLADKILVPFTFQLEDISKYGATTKKLIKYPGLKEEVYLWQFKPQSNFWITEFPQLDSSKIMCTVRPPATMAAYHDFENLLFADLLNYLLKKTDLQLVVFPRTDEQREQLNKEFPSLFVAEKSVAGDQLIAMSDLIISAGGTMNREAAVLGTPAYTIYAGKMGSVDHFLIDKGKIVLLEKKEDLSKIVLRKNAKVHTDVEKKVFNFILYELITD